MKNIFYYLVFILISLNGYCQNKRYTKIDTTYNGFKVAYYSNKNLKSKIEFKKGRPNGLAQMYNENGKLSETGTFVNGRWVGNYQLYYDNGQVMHSFNFDKEGKRIGFQRYFHKNGILAVVGNFYNGKEDGFILEFSDVGQLIQSKLFNDGREQPHDSAQQKKYSELLESMVSFVKNENEIVLNARKLKKAEEEIEIRKQELLRQKLIRNSFLVGTLLLLIFLFFVFISLQKNIRQRKTITEKHTEIEAQKKVIEEKQKDIIDSIKYARRIQHSLLPTEKYISKNLTILQVKKPDR